MEIQQSTFFGALHVLAAELSHILLGPEDLNEPNWAEIDKELEEAYTELCEKGKKEAENNN